MQVAETGARKRSEKRERQERLTVRFSPAERQEVEALASRAGLTLASYLRSRALAEPTTRARRKPSIDQAAVSKQIGELGRVKNNLNQLAKKANAGTLLHQEILAALAVIQEIGQTAKDSMRNV